MPSGFEGQTFRNRLSMKANRASATERLMFTFGRGAGKALTNAWQSRYGAQFHV